ncbi:hypothetical protein [Streptococcus ovis]|uniref:hypothetical protein n=1 Tax=Streptococcus ovis TaxID=82806 RepID=UPI0003818AB7|nr:hypothetical protein [Streptococcus ovis]
MLEIRFQADYSKENDQLAFVRKCLRLVFHQEKDQLWYVRFGNSFPRPMSTQELEKALLQADLLTHFQLFLLADGDTVSDWEQMKEPMKPLAASIDVQNGDCFILRTRLAFFPNALHFLQENTYNLTIETKR